MKIRSLSSLALTVAAGGALALAGLSALRPTDAVAAAPVAAQSAEAYAVDAVHSSVIFRVKHLNTSYFYGRFNGGAGSFNLNFAKPEASVLEVSVKTEDVDTGNAGRDKHLRSEDFFSAKEHPTIAFKGKTFKKTSDTVMEVAGDLTLHGQTKPITITVEATGAGKGMKGESVAGIESKFTIKRTDYGMKGLVGPVGDEVTLMVAFEGSRK